MLFNFLKYLQPTIYFQVYRNDNTSIFPVFDQLPEDVLNRLLVDEGYDSLAAQHYDLSWQAIRSGFIDNVDTYDKFDDISLKDNYRFLKKNFHWIWVLYVLLLRLFSLHNPFKEINAWLKSSNVKRVNFNAIKSFKNKGEKTLSLFSQNPKLSVIIPTLNRYQHLGNVLSDFERQDYKNFEIIIVDQSDDFNASFYKQFNLDIKVVRQKEKALWLARNTAIKKASAEIIALSEDDVRINSNWLSEHLRCLDVCSCQISAGILVTGEKVKSNAFYSLATHFATGNSMLFKQVFKDVGLFDRQFEKQRMGDGEFGMRTYLNSVKSVSNPFAFCIDVKAPTGGLRELGSWDAFRPVNLLSPRPIPSVLYYYRNYFGKQRTKLALIKLVPMSLIPYRYKKQQSMLILGALFSIVLFPLVLFQVSKSWKLASRKIAEGPKIDTF